MSNSKKTDFEERYRDALAGYLQRSPKGNSASRVARKLGHEALEMDIDSMDLIRIHNQAMQSLPEGCHPFDGNATTTEASGKFLIDSLDPIERAKHAEKTHLKLDLKKAQRMLREQGKRHDKLLNVSQRQQKQARQLTHQFFLAQEKERKEISRDLHDEIAQVLAGINMRLAALKKHAHLDFGSIGPRIAETQKLVERSVSAVHRYALQLRPSLLDDMGLVPSLRSCIQNLPGRNGLSIRLKANDEFDFLNNEQRTALYRVAQEALANVVRHAEATKVGVNLRRISDRVQLKVHDDGKSFNPKRKLDSISRTRLGLPGMRERVEMLGGVFSIESSPEKGTSIIAEIPIDSVVPNSVS